MSDFEKACRYLCLKETTEDYAMINRYKDIENMIHGDTALIERYAKKYEKLLDLLSF